MLRKSPENKYLSIRLTMENKKIFILHILIDFFASLYDLSMVVFASLIKFFASLYDMVYDFMTFIWEYLKWVTTIETTHTNDFNTPVEEPIKVHSQNHFDIR